jgi:flagellar hook-associated protein 3 FlgL
MCLLTIRRRRRHGPEHHRDRRCGPIHAERQQRALHGAVGKFSTLSSVVTSLTQAVSLGTEGANGTNSAANLQALANAGAGHFVQRGVGGKHLGRGRIPVWRNQHGNSLHRGFVVADRLHLQRQQRYNSVAVGDQMSVQVNLPGSQIFSNSSNNVLGSLSSLVTALQSGNSSDIETATSAVDSALNYVGQQQVFYGNAENQLNSQQTFLQQDTVTLSTQENNLIGVNEATAAPT